ncbi:MAG: hypothetical protein ABR925_07225 [Acidimicrobiales bacterium]
MATRFALDCGERALGEAGDVRLPNGSPHVPVIADVKRTLDDTTSEGKERLGYLARGRALRRSRHD